MRLWRFFKESTVGAILISFLIGGTICSITITHTLATFFFGGILGVCVLFLYVGLRLLLIKVLTDWERTK